MSNVGTSAFFGLLVLIGTIGSWVISGMLAWEWVEPHSFGKVILFLIVWTVFGGITNFISSLILQGIANLLK